MQRSLSVLSKTLTLIEDRRRRQEISRWAVEAAELQRRKPGRRRDRRSWSIVQSRWMTRSWTLPLLRSSSRNASRLLVGSLAHLVMLSLFLVRRPRSPSPLMARSRKGSKDSPFYWFCAWLFVDNTMHWDPCAIDWSKITFLFWLWKLGLWLDCLYSYVKESVIGFFFLALILAIFFKEGMPMYC